MKNFTRFLIPLGLGAAAFVFNWMAVKPQLGRDYVVVSQEVDLDVPLTDDNMAKFTIVKQEKQWLAKSISGSFYPIDLDLSPRVPDMFESLVAMEHDRVALGRVGCNPDYLVKLRDSIGIEDDLLQFELSIDAGRPLVMRHTGNIAMLMPATGNEFEGIKALIYAAKEAINIHPSRDLLAEMILKTFGVSYAKDRVGEDDRSVAPA